MISAATLRRSILFLAFLMSGGNLIFPRVPILALMVLLMLIGTIGQSTARAQGRFGLIVMLVGVVCALGLVHSNMTAIQPTMVRLANFGAGLLLLRMYLQAGLEKLPQDIGALMPPLAWQAILTVPLAYFLGFLFVPIDVNETIYYSFLLVFNYHVVLEDAGGLMRPDGFFFEPGVFHIYLNLFLYVALFIEKSRTRTVLAVAAVFATQSTTGLAICMLQLAVALWKHVSHVRFGQKVAALAVAALLAAPLGLVVRDNIVSKFTGDLAGSSWARQYDLLTGINVIVENPLWGIGFDHDTYKAAAARLGYADTQLEDRTTLDRGNSNGIVFLFYSIGIPLALMFLWGMFRQRMFPDRALVGLCLFLSFIGESIIFTPFFLMIIFSGLVVLRKRKATTAPAIAGAARASA